MYLVLSSKLLLVTGIFSISTLSNLGDKLPEPINLLMSSVSRYFCISCFQIFSVSGNSTQFSGTVSLGDETMIFMVNNKIKTSLSITFLFLLLGEKSFYMTWNRCYFWLPFIFFFCCVCTEVFQLLLAWPHIFRARVQFSEKKS